MEARMVVWKMMYDLHMIYTYDIYIYIYIRIWYIFLYIFIHILCVTSSDIPSHLILMVIFRFHFVNFQGSNLWGDSIGVGRGARSHGVEIFIQKLVADRCWNAGRTSILPCFFLFRWWWRTITGKCLFSKKNVLRNGPSIQEFDVFSRVKEIVRFDDQWWFLAGASLRWAKEWFLWFGKMVDKFSKSLRRFSKIHWAHPQEDGFKTLWSLDVYEILPFHHLQVYVWYRVLDIRERHLNFTTMPSKRLKKHLSDIKLGQENQLQLQLPNLGTTSLSSIHHTNINIILTPTWGEMINFDDHIFQWVGSTTN